MKKSFGGLDIEISDWTPKLKIAAVIFSFITIISIGITIFFRYTIPGLTPITFSIVMLLFGIREFNVYFKRNKNKFIITLGIIFTMLFAFGLCIGIKQIVDAVMSRIGL